MTRERIGREFYADSNRIKELYREAVGEDIDPLTGEQVPMHVKLLRFFNALGLRLNPTRRLGFGASFLGFALYYFTSGFLANALLFFSFSSMFMILILELLEKFDAKKEIDFARDIQLSLLPESQLIIENLEIASFANTANEVGGDYVDAVHTDEGTYVIIADVSGKGLSAALYMVRMQAMVHLLINKGIDGPKQLFLELNNFIKSDKRDKTFVTTCAAYFPKEKDYFIFTRAGHNPPIIYTYENDRILSLRSAGLALGMATTEKLKKHLKEIEVHFKPNDSILFYTDGLTEARNFEGKEFGSNRLESIMDIYGSLDSASIIDKIESTLDAFIGDERQYDDITFTVIHKQKPKTTVNKAVDAKIISDKPIKEDC